VSFFTLYITVTIIVLIQPQADTKQSIYLLSLSNDALKVTVGFE